MAFLDTLDQDDDDWQVTITSGPNLTAFAFDLVDNNDNVDDLFSVFGPGDLLLGVLQPPLSPGNDSAFIGVVATGPIVRLHYNDDDRLDDIFVKNFRFATNPVVVPEPSIFIYWTNRSRLHLSQVASLSG